MEPQKPTQSEIHPNEKHHKHEQENHHSTVHLFNPHEHKEIHHVTPYSLYLMNNNWHADLDKEDPRNNWSWPDYVFGFFAGIFLFLGLALTELVNIHFGKSAVAIYLVLLVTFFFLTMMKLFYRKKSIFV